MIFFKKKIDTKSVAEKLIHITILQTKKCAPSFLEEMKTTFKDDFLEKNEKNSYFYISLAILAFEVIAIRNLENKKFADNICWHIDNYLGPWATNELNEFIISFVTTAKEPNPIFRNNDGIPGTLLKKNLDKNISYFQKEIKGKTIIRILGLEMTTAFLTDLIGNWVQIKKEYKISN